MIKKNLILITFVLTMLILVGCKIKEEIYQGEYNLQTLYEQKVKYEKIPLELSYRKASHGYTLNDKQGYNRWYYLDDKLNELPYVETFTNGNNYLDNEFMSGNVTRMFLVDKDGIVFINGNIISVEGNNVLDVYVNERKIKQYNIDESYNDGIEVLIENVELQVDDEIYFKLTGSGKISFNPIIDYEYNENNQLHYNSSIDTEYPYVGDVHPYYEGGKLSSYYLSTNGKFTANSAVSQNMITFESGNLTNESVNSPGFATRVVKIKDKYYSMYGAHDKFVVSNSDDGINWKETYEVDDNFFQKGILNVAKEFSWGRDPYAFYNPDIGKYQVLSLQYYYDNSEYHSALVLSTSRDDSLDYFEENSQIIYRNKSKNNDYEVSQFIQIGQRWYLVTSIYGKSNYGVGGITYYIGDYGKKIDQVNWEKKTPQVLTSDALCAAQIYEVEDRYFLQGWIAQKYNSNNWGGTINFPIEVKQKTNGILKTSYNDEFIYKAKYGKKFDLANSNDLTSLTASNALIEASFDNINDDVGLTFKVSQSEITIKYIKEKATIVMLVNGLKVIDYQYKKVNEIDFTILIEDNLIEFMVNKDIVLHSRLQVIMNNYQIKFLSKETKPNKMKIYGLANYIKIN